MNDYALILHEWNRNLHSNYKKTEYFVFHWSQILVQTGEFILISGVAETAFEKDNLGSKLSLSPLASRLLG